MILRKIYFIVLVAMLPLAVEAAQPLSLGDAIALGLDNNFDIKIAQGGHDIAERSNSWGMAGGLPTISLNGGFDLDGELLEPRDHDFSGYASANLDWVLFGGFRVRATKQILNSNELLAEGSEELAMESTLHSIINSYFYVLLQQEMLKIMDNILSISKDRLDQESLSLSLGASGRYEYVQAQSAYLTDQSNRLKQEVALRDAMRSLNLLLSMPAESEWILSEDVDAPKFDYSLDVMREQMLSDNRMLKNQYINLRAMDFELQQSRSTLYPIIGLGASLRGGNRALSMRPESNYLTPNVGLSMSFNLFNGGKTRRGVDMAKIEREVESLSTDKMVLAMESELASQYDGYNIYREIVKCDGEQLDVARLLMDLSEERYRSGTITSFNFREVQLSYLQSATSRLNSIYSLIVINSELLRLTGGIMSYAR